MKGAPGVVGGVARVGDPVCRDHLRAIDLAIVEVRQAETGEVAQRTTHPALHDRCTQAVEHDVGVVLLPERRPQITGEHLRERQVVDHLDHPSSDVGQRRAVLELAAVWKRRAIGAEVAVDAEQRPIEQPAIARLTLVLDQCRRAVRVVVVVVVLEEVGARSHVDHVLHRGTVEAGASELGGDFGDQIVGPQQTAPDRDAQRRTGERLRHAHQQVRGVRRHPVQVTLEHDPSVVHDADAVTHASFELLAPCRRAGDVTAHRHLIEWLQVDWQLAVLAAAIADQRSRHQFTDPLEGGTIVRRLQPVVECERAGDHHATVAKCKQRPRCAHGVAP